MLRLLPCMPTTHHTVSPHYQQAANATTTTHARPSPAHEGQRLAYEGQRPAHGGASPAHGGASEAPDRVHLECNICLDKCQDPVLALVGSGDNGSGLVVGTRVGCRLVSSDISTTVRAGARGANINPNRNPNPNPVRVTIARVRVTKSIRVWCS